MAISAEHPVASALPAGRSGSDAPAGRPPLRRPRASAVAGVCAGLARHLGWSVGLVRTLFAVLTVFWGAGLLLYAWFWATVPLAEAPADVSGEPGGAAPGEAGPTRPEAPHDASAARGGVGGSAPTHRVPVAWLLTVLSAVGLSVTFGVVATSGETASYAGLVVVTVVLAVGAGLWATLIDRADPARGPRHELAVRIAVTVVLGILWIGLLAAGQPGAGGFLLALLPLVGIAGVYASSLVEKVRDLSHERVRRIREEQRSEMAAHLHDSVLQTLALIQHRAGASSEVARLARAQERELRSWLYEGDSPADSDLPTDLRDYAAALELDYPVRIDVVSAGESRERASGEVAAAAREAMLNAARHAGGEVSVYIEGTGASIDVYVRDRGPGFDPGAVPADRLGVRESIVGRMRRAGGGATVRPGAGEAGTEVHLRFERAEP